MTTTELARCFLDYGRYVRGWSLRTIRTYRQSLTALPAMSVLDLSRAALQALVVSLRMRGLTPGGINVRLRSINSYLSWLHIEGHIAERLRVRLLPDPPKPLTPISDERFVGSSSFGRMVVCRFVRGH